MTFMIILGHSLLLSCMVVIGNILLMDEKLGGVQEHSGTQVQKLFIELNLIQTIQMFGHFLFQDKNNANGDSKLKKVGFIIQNI